MTSLTYRNIILGLLFCLSCSIPEPGSNNKFSTPENPSNFAFVDTDSINISESSNTPPLLRKYEIDYFNVLFLSPHRIDEISRVAPSILEEYQNSPSESILTTDSIYTPFESIKKCFNDLPTLNNILASIETPQNLNLTNISNVIYTKQDSQGIFEIYGSSWQETYYITLNKGLLQIGLIEAVIE